MDFFKSVFPDPDPDPGNSPPDSPQNSRNEEIAAAEIADETVGAWSLGGFIKTISAKSESVIQIYRRDLEEFSSGIKKETAAIRDAAARAVLDLPGSLEAGASVAQESLETVGQAIDDFGGSVWRGTAEILSHGKDALLSIDSDGSDSSPSEPNPTGASSKRYSRFEARVLAIQSDPRTFREEPEDLEEFNKWKEGFRVEEKKEEVQGLLYESSALEGFFEKIVPSVVDYETFWSRYFYRVHKLKQIEDARTNLVMRVISRDEDEDLSWEVDDDSDDDDEKREQIDVVNVQNIGKLQTLQENELVESSKVENFDVEVNNAGPASADDGKREEIEAVNDEHVEKSEPLVENELVKSLKVENCDVEVDNAVSESDETISKSNDQVQLESKVEAGGSSKDSDFSVLSSQPSIPGEDELEWDEIEDLGEHDDKKLNGSSGSPSRVELQKRLSVAQEDEYLSWDIEDDFEPDKP